LEIKKKKFNLDISLGGTPQTENYMKPNSKPKTMPLAEVAS